MSRTYRKRKGNPYWDTEEEFNEDKKLWEESTNKYWKWWRKYSYKAELAHYHSDSGNFMNWSKMEIYNDSWRNQIRMAIRREFFAEEKGNVIFPVRKQFMDYYW